jgi:RNA polymerase sigma factor (sigma-70 family)
MLRFLPIQGKPVWKVETVTDEEVDKWSNLVNHTAWRMSKRYPMIDREDIVQEIWMWFLTHPDKCNEWSKLEPKDEAALVGKSIGRAALKYCEKEKAKAFGYELADIYYYDKNTVEIFLPSIISNDYEIPEGLLAGVDKSARVTKDPAEGNGWLAMRADISRGFDLLPIHHKEMLVHRFIDENRTYRQLGDTLGISEDATRKRVDRAIKALINKIGGTKPW